MDWEIGVLVYDKEEIMMLDYQLHHMSYSEYLLLSKSYGHKRVKPVIVHIAAALPKHRWSDLSKRSLRYKFARTRNNRAMIQHWRERSRWVSKAFSPATTLLRDSLWFMSLRADSEALDGVATVEAMVACWGVERSVELSHRKVPMQSLLDLLDSGVDAELVDSLIGLRAS